MGKKQILTYILCTVMVVSLIACGRQEESAATGVREFVYVSEYFSLEGNGQNSYFSNFALSGDNLYYIQGSYGESTNTSSELLYEYFLEDGSVRELPIKVPEGRTLSDYAPDENENIYVVMRELYSEEMEEDGSGMRDVFLCKYDSKGKAVFEKDITEAFSRAGEDTFPVDMIVDGQNNIYICFSSKVLLLNGEGEDQGMVEVPNGWINSIALGKDGKVYICYFSNSLSMETAISEINFAGKKS